MRFMRGKMLVVLGGSAVALIFTIGALMPDVRHNRRKNQEAAMLRASVDGRTARLQGAAAMRETSHELENKLTAFTEAIPGEQRIGAFLEALDQIARDAGLTGKNVKPAQPVVGDEVACLPIQVEVSGTFASIHEFLRRVETLPRLARIQRVELAGGDDLGGELVSSVMMQVYFRPS